MSKKAVFILFKYEQEGMLVLGVGVGVEQKAGASITP